MDTALLSGIFALAGVLLGGLASHILSLRREREARTHSLDVEHRNMLRAKYEKLYSLIAQWSLAMSTSSLGFSAAMQGKITYDDANDLLIKDAGRRQVDFEKIELLIDAYSPACRANFDKCIEWRSKINAVHADFRHQYDAEDPYGSYDQLPAYTQAIVGFEGKLRLSKSRLSTNFAGFPNPRRHSIAGTSVPMHRL